MNKNTIQINQQNHYLHLLLVWHLVLDGLLVLDLYWDLFLPWHQQKKIFLEQLYCLSFYSLGLAIPFILSGFLIQKFLVFSKNFKKNINKVSKVGGVILLITGILIITNQLQTLGYYILNIFPFFQNFG